MGGGCAIVRAIVRALEDDFFSFWTSLLKGPFSKDASVEGTPIKNTLLTMIKRLTL